MSEARENGLGGASATIEDEKTGAEFGAWYCLVTDGSRAFRELAREYGLISYVVADISRVRKGRIRPDLLP